MIRLGAVELGEANAKDAVDKEIQSFLELGRMRYLEDSNIWLQNNKWENKFVIESESYFIVENDTNIDMKAVVRMASFKMGRNNKADPKQFASDLRNLGYEIYHCADVVVTSPSQIKEFEESYYRTLSRKGQSVFREKVYKRFEGECILTGCKVVQALEAAHIQPFAEKPNYDEENGILLRADVHKLFDFNLIGINPRNFNVTLHKTINGSYNKIIKSRLDEETIDKLESEFFNQRWKIFQNS